MTHSKPVLIIAVIMWFFSPFFVFVFESQSYLLSLTSHAPFNLTRPLSFSSVWPVYVCELPTCQTTVTCFKFSIHVLLEFCTRWYTFTMLFLLAITPVLYIRCTSTGSCTSTLTYVQPCSPEWNEWKEHVEPIWPEFILAYIIKSQLSCVTDRTKSCVYWSRQKIEEENMSILRILVMIANTGLWLTCVSLSVNHASS